MTTHYVIGLGEVGTALTQVLECEGADVEAATGPADQLDIDTLHIAYPWSDSFVADTYRYSFLYSPTLIVVHSTVPVGTCDPPNWVHSPVRGQHPNLTNALKTFIKPFGGPRAPEAAAQWPGSSFTTAIAAETEAGKLWELAQFGIQVRINQAIYEWCEEKGLDPSAVYDMFAFSYNMGYIDMGKDKFVRPVLEYVPGEIGGHCVVPGAKLLDHPLIDLI